MRVTSHGLHASGLPRCWATVYQALRPADCLEQAVRHTAGSLNRMPAVYRWGGAIAVRLFPAVFYGVTRRRPHTATAEEIRRGLTRLRALPGYGQLMRATTALALYGGLEGGPAKAVRGTGAPR